MTAHVETMAYANELPWHGLGEKVSNDISVEDMLKVSGLDWTVSKRPLYFRKEVAEGEKMAMRIAPQTYGLVRDTDQTFLDTVGENFKPVQNRDAVEFFTRFVKAGDMRMETMGSLKNGRFIWALARIDESFKIGGIDETQGYLLLSSPHQFGFSLTAALTPVRVVCWNTITAALGHNLSGTKNKEGSTFRMTHAATFDDEMKAKAEQALGLAHTSMKAFSHTAEMLSGIGAKPAAILDYYYDVMQIERDEDAEADEDFKLNSTIDKFSENLTFAPGQQISTAKGTWWGAFNSVTYTVDHKLGRSNDNRLHSAWYGFGATMKRRALELAVTHATNSQQLAA